VTEQSFKLLIVEDWAEIVQSIITALTKSHPKLLIEVANTFDKAIEKFESFKPDLVLTDQSFPASEGKPESNLGLKLMEHILGIASGTKIIAMSGIMPEETEKFCQKSNILKLSKPFRIATLRDLVSQSLNTVPVNPPAQASTADM